MELSAPKRRNSNLRTNHEFCWGFWKCRVHFHSIWMLHRIAPWLVASSNIFQARGQTCDPSGFCCHKMPTPQRKKRKNRVPRAPKKWNLHLNLQKIWDNVAKCSKNNLQKACKWLSGQKDVWSSNSGDSRRDLPGNQLHLAHGRASAEKPAVSKRAKHAKRAEKCPFCRLSWQLCPLATMACCQRFAWAHLDWKGLFTNFCQELVITAISDKSNKNSNSR